MIDRLQFFYGFFLPFTSAFTFFGFVGPSLVSNLVLVLVSLFWRKVKFDKYYLIVLILLFLVFISTVINSINFVESKPLNHLMAMVLTFNVMFYGIYIHLKSENNIQSLIKGVYWGFIFSLIYLLIEFISKNIFGMDFEYLPRSVAAEYDPTFAGFIVRPRSFVEESGHFALYMNVVYFLLCAWLKGFSKNRYYLALFAVCLILTFSYSGILFILMATLLNHIIAVFRRELHLKDVIKKWSIVVFVSLIAYLIFDLITGDANFFLSLIGKFTDTDPNSSMGDRSGRMELLTNIIINTDWLHLIFGYGPSFYTTLNVISSVSLPLTWLLEYGFLYMFLVVLLYLMICFVNECDVDVNRRGYQRILLIYLPLHYFTISNYWYPWLWLVLAFVLVRRKVDD